GRRLLPDLPIFQSDAGVAFPAVELAGDGGFNHFALLLIDVERRRSVTVPDRRADFADALGLDPVVQVLELFRVELVEARSGEFLLRHAFLKRGCLGLGEDRPGKWNGEEGGKNEG